MNPNLFFKNQLPEEVLRRRLAPRNKDRRDLRGAFFRDTTAIIHSSPFRRLKHKTQVFFAPKNDHICTRIEHAMHVATVAATVCRALDLDSDLAWAIGLGHDLGHTPFGHLGESILGRLSPRGQNFRHEIYSLRVVDHLANDGEGLNLTYAVRDGIINHCGEKFESAIQPDFSEKELSAITDRTHYPSTWEGTVVRMCDKVAYLGRDLEDGLRLGIVQPGEIPREASEVLGTDNSTIIDTLVNDLIRCSLETGTIGFSGEIFRAFYQMKDFNYQRIYKSPQLANYHSSFERIMTTLYQYLAELFDRFGTDTERYAEDKNRVAFRFGDYIRKMASFYLEEDGSWDWLVTDYIAGMSDSYALEAIGEIMVPTQFQVQFEKTFPPPFPPAEE